MTNKEDPKDLLAELEALQRVLDSSSSADDDNAEIPVLDDLFDAKADIPVVSDSISSSSTDSVTNSPTSAQKNSVSDAEIPVLSATPSASKASDGQSPLDQTNLKKISSSPLRAVPNVTPAAPLETLQDDDIPSNVSPLNQVLNKIHQQANDEAPKPAGSLSEVPPEAPTVASKRAEIDATMSETTASLTNLLQRERMVDEVLEEVMPMIKSRLRARIRDMLNGKDDA